MFPADMTLMWSEFQRVGVATEKALAPKLVSTRGTKSRSELDDRSCLGRLAGVSSGCKYTSCLDESGC